MKTHELLIILILATYFVAGCTTGNEPAPNSVGDVHYGNNEIPPGSDTEVDITRGPDAINPTDTTPDIQDMPTERPTLVPPVVAEEAACEEPTEDDTQPETFDDWVSGAEVVVVGTVAELTPVFVPFRLPQIVPQAVSWDETDCEAEILPAIDVRLSDVETLYGEAREDVVFRIGIHLMGEWDSHAVLNTAGEYMIVSNSDPRHGIAQGMRIGTRLYTSTSLPSVLSPAMTWLFSIDSEERLRFEVEPNFSPCAGDVGYYLRNVDAVHDGLALSELREGLRSAEAARTSGEDARPELSSRPYIQEIWNRVADDYHVILLGAAYCDSHEHSTNDCLSNEDCQPLHECIDGQCIGM